MRFSSYTGKPVTVKVHWRSVAITTTFEGVSVLDSARQDLLVLEREDHRYEINRDDCRFVEYSPDGDEVGS